MTALAVAAVPPPLPTDAQLPDHCKPGKPWPLGATLAEGGVNFAVFSSVAEKVEICLFDRTGTREVRRLALPCRTDDVWHGFVPGLPAGTRYGLRVHGPYNPAEGLRCNPHKLLLDPYAKALDRPLRGGAWQYAYTLGGPARDLAMDTVDNAAGAAKCIVPDPEFDWGDDRRPEIPLEDTVFYEVHVRGFTKLMDEVPHGLRGTFAGLASEPAIAHFKRLGVTSIELLPVHAFNDERRLIDLGLANYWGYNTVAFFAPEPRYCAGNDPDDFKRMVKALHAAGLEVILDVVYNHSCEGNHLGPTLFLKGIDNPAYYRLAEDRRYYADVTGTGNTLDISHPATLRLMMDSLRYWVEEMHVDGFRFDLAPAVARNGQYEFDHRSPFLAAVAQDPVLRRVKLVAEPWDIGDNGYQVGGFPPGWSEWNGRYRDSVRDFWRGTDGAVQEFAARLAGSADIFGPSRRQPSASVNLVTVHDGFTLNDLVSYNDKHNEANAEDNRDGESHNRSWNCGVEGETDDPDVLALRERQKRNFLTTLFVSRGVPLLLGGDEMGRTQGGNNNAYCQDNPVSWYDWSEERRGDPLIAFTRELIALRRELPVLRDNRWPTGQPDEDERRDLAWYSVWGLPMTEEEWTNPSVRCIAALFDGRFTPVEGQPSPGVLLLFNASDEAVVFTLPEAAGVEEWRVRVDTGEGTFSHEEAERVQPQAKIELDAHAMAVLVEGRST
ncbi:MAG TPA: glycogen debranching protein GlgX [Ramlibacter sp.]|jgi:glycogen operon protein|uniref:glycogen debranching protein GlgX n=1 Tax=Ramlibacter sp. TaxID=1917967 RepID=UPI002D4E293A|nr:glycogen debranching protein GlgX [Ramlibacter sp.]HZY18352.1 glycogen debranching protein GlgX [Ramlibacter sp.]